MKIKLALLILLFLSSCHIDSQEKVRSTNDKFSVELLFEVDGCKVYRFWDNRYVYFTNCNGEVSWDVSKGKYGTERYTVPTNK